MLCDVQQFSIKINLCKFFSAFFIILVFVWIIHPTKNENLHRSQTLKFVIAVSTKMLFFKYRLSKQNSKIYKQNLKWHYRRKKKT